VFKVNAQHADRSLPPRTARTKTSPTSIYVFDGRDQMVEVLGRLAELDPPRAAFNAIVAKYPQKRIFPRHGGRVIQRSDRPV
jgi:hypothetical protein